MVSDSVTGGHELESSQGDLTSDPVIHLMIWEPARTPGSILRGWVSFYKTLVETFYEFTV